MSNHKPTSQQEAFAQFLAQGKDQAKAKRLAYPKCKLTGNALYVNASRLANLAKIRLRVAELQKATTDLVVKDMALSKEYVLAQLHNNALKASQAVPALDRKGQPTGEYTYYPTAVNRAYELMGKELGMFVERNEHTGAGGRPLVITLVLGDKPRIVDGTVIEERKALKDGSG